MSEVCPRGVRVAARALIRPPERGESAALAALHVATWKEGEFAARGVADVSLWVMAANDRVRRWYERRGWQLDGRERDEAVWGTPIRAVGYRITRGPAA